MFVQQSSHVLEEVDIRERKRLLETKECELGRKGRSSGKAKTGDLRLQQFEESLSWDEHQSVTQLSQFKIMKFQLLDLTGCRAWEGTLTDLWGEGKSVRKADLCVRGLLNVVFPLFIQWHSHILSHWMERVCTACKDAKSLRKCWQGFSLWNTEKYAAVCVGIGISVGGGQSRPGWVGAGEGGAQSCH